MESFEEIVKGLTKEILDVVPGQCQSGTVDAANNFLSRYSSKLRFDKVKWIWSEEVDENHETHSRKDADHETRTPENADPETHTTDNADHQTYSTGSPNSGTPTATQGTRRSQRIAGQGSREPQRPEITHTGTPTATQGNRRSQRIAARGEITHHYNFRPRENPDKKKELIGKALKGYRGKRYTGRKHTRTSLRGTTSRDTLDQMSEGATLGGDTSEEQPFEATSQLAEKAREEKADEAEKEEPSKESDQGRSTFDGHGGDDEPRDATLMDYERELKMILERFSLIVRERLRILEKLFKTLLNEFSILGRLVDESTLDEPYKERCRSLDEICHLIKENMQSITIALRSISDDIRFSDKSKKDHIRNLLNKISGARLEIMMTEEFQSMTRQVMKNLTLNVTGPNSTSSSASEKEYILAEFLGPKRMKKETRNMPNWEQWHLSRGDLERFTKPIKEKDKAYIKEYCFDHNWADFEGSGLDWADVLSLRPGYDLRDDVVNRYMDLLLSREISLRSLDGKPFYYFPTFFYLMGQTAMERLDVGKACQVQDWQHFYDTQSLDRQDVALANSNYVLIPVCDNRHYLLLMFDINRWELLILDPSPRDFSYFQDRAANFVTISLNHIVYMKAPDRFKSSAPQCYIPDEKNMPKQINGNDCGVLVCKYVDAFTQGLNIADMHWTQEDLDNFRYRLVKELVIKRRCRNMFGKNSNATGEDGSTGDKK